MSWPVLLSKDNSASTKSFGSFGFFSNTLGCQILKNVQNQTTRYFSVGNTKVKILALTAGAVSKSKIRLTFI